MMLSDLCARVEGTLIGNDVAVTAICTDTRSLKRGDVFLALRGDNFDGHDFVSIAEKQGAAAVVVEKKSSASITQLLVDDTLLALGQAGALNRARTKSLVLAITGSSGKTSVKGMLQSILSKVGNTLATEGNYNNHIGVPLTLLKIEGQHKYAVVEAGTSSKGEIAYLNKLIKPEIALVNNIMLAHGEGFGSEKAIAEEKAALYRGVKVGVVNLMDEYSSYFCECLAGKKIYAFSVIEQGQEVLQSSVNQTAAVDAFILGTQLEYDEHGCYKFRLTHAENAIDIALKVPGKHSVSNALAAAACAIAAGAGLADVAAGLTDFYGVKGRMQHIDSTCVAKLIDDSYNANPGSMRAAVDFLAKQQEPILIAGDMGELGSTEIEEHRKLGQYAKKSGIKNIYAVGSLSKYVVEAFGEGAVWFDSKESMVRYLEKKGLQSATVLVKGSRYMHMESVVEFLKNKKGVDKC